MIVVNQARRLIGQQVNVVVTGALQTSAGRMIFAEVKSESTKPSEGAAKPATPRRSSI